MMHWFTRVAASATASMTFFTIFLVGVVFSLFTLLLGDSDHDHDMGHDADHGGDLGHDGDGHFSVGVFSIRGMALLATGFGGLGFLFYTWSRRLVFSTAAALIGGYVFAFVVLYLLRIFRSQQSNSLIDMSKAVGTEGVVTVSIPDGGMGEVSLLVSGSELFKPARSLSGDAIRSGMRVHVDRIVGGMLIVTLADAGPKSPAAAGH